MLTDDDLRAMLAHALEAEADARGDDRMLAAVARGFVSACDIGPFEEGHAEAMRAAFIAHPATALADLEASAPEWPWAFMLENLDRRLCEALERSVALGLTLALVWRSADEFEREEQIEAEAFEAIQRVETLRALLTKQRAKTNAVLRALPEVAA